MYLPHGAAEQLALCFQPRSGFALLARNEQDGWRALAALWGLEPGDGEACFYMLVDPDGRSEFAGDDMTIEDGEQTPTCSQDGENLEFKILRSGPRRPGVQYNAECVVARDASQCERG